MLKITRHWDAIHNPELTPKYSVDEIKDRRLVHKEELDTATNRIIKRSELQSIDRVKEMQNYKCSDFCLENLLSCGVDLKPVKMSGNSFDTLDRMESFINNVE